MAEFWIWNAITTREAKQLQFERMKMKLAAHLPNLTEKTYTNAIFKTAYNKKLFLRIAKNYILIVHFASNHLFIFRRVISCQTNALPSSIKFVHNLFSQIRPKKMVRAETTNIWTYLSKMQTLWYIVSHKRQIWYNNGQNCMIKSIPL